MPWEKGKRRLFIFLVGCFVRAVIFLFIVSIPPGNFQSKMKYMQDVFVHPLWSPLF